MDHQRVAVHAIAQAGRLRTVVEDVAEMAAAAGAMHRCPHRAERSIPGGADRLFQWRPKARPAGAAVVLRGRGEQVEVATRAGEISAPLLMKKRAGERPLG